MSDQEFRKTNQGKSFKDGKLYHFYPAAIHVVRLWPSPRVWVKSINNPSWQGRRTIFLDIVKSTGLSRRTLARPRPLPRLPAHDFRHAASGEQLPIDKFLSAVQNKERQEYRNAVELVPSEVRGALATYPGSHFVFSVLQACYRVPEMPAFVAANPCLAFLFASVYERSGPGLNSGMMWRTWRRTIRLKQRDICGWVKLPDAEWVVSLLKRASPEICSASGGIWNLFANLRRSAGLPLLQNRLQHMDSFNRQVLIVLRNDELWPLVHPRLLSEISRGSWGSHRMRPAQLLDDVVQMTRMLDRGEPLRYVTDLAQLRELHDRLARRLHVNLEDLRRQRRHPGRMPEFIEVEFPPPPLPGTAQIIPLTNQQRFSREEEE